MSKPYFFNIVHRVEGDTTYCDPECIFWWPDHDEDNDDELLPRCAARLDDCHFNGRLCPDLARCSEGHYKAIRTGDIQ